MNYKALYLTFCSAIMLYGLLAWEADYRVKSMGITISDIHMELDSRQIRVEAKNRERSLVAPRMDNSYYSRFDSAQLPIVYRRVVDQSEDSGTTVTRYDHSTGQAMMQGGRYLEGISFALDQSTRDIFSFLAHLCIAKPESSGRYTIDANSELWDLDLGYDGRVRLRTDAGTYDCHKYSISLRGRGSDKAPYVDMVTNNILNPDTRLTVWIASNGLIAQAQVKRGISTMNWELKSFRP